MKLLGTQKGSILISMLLVFPFLIVMVLFYMSLATSSFKIATNDQSHTHSQLAVDAGIDQSLQEINADSNWVGTSGEITLHNESTVRTTYQVSVVDIDATNKLITSTGRTYKPASATTASSTINIEVNVRAVNTGGAFSIVSGVGGLELENSAKILNGSVYVNGTLSMQNTAQIGLSFLPVNVSVAHQSCPGGSSPGATYPRVCAADENGQPISILNSAHIYGRVEATNQTTGTAMTNPGLITGASPPPLTMPGYDRDAQKAAVTSTQTAADAGCSFGLKNWPANLKITGDLNVSNLCLITVSGDVWITGNFDFRNISVLKVAEGVTTPPVIMIDGASGLSMRNSAALLPNLDGIGFRIITYYSTDSCQPDCADVTGTALKNSQSVETIVLRNGASALRTEFYARWTKITVENTGAIGALAGQTILLRNSAAVTFGATVSGVSLPPGWVINSYKRAF